MPCNICGSTDFEAYRGRPAEKCIQCGSKARHRVALDVYQRFLPALSSARSARALHLAPEACLVPSLKSMFGGGYICSDPVPERYPHAECLRLAFPDDFGFFPDGYFDVILHNHVLEHIPGHYGDHLADFGRLLSPGGMMIFSVPGPYRDRQTVEGGEHMATGKERLEAFLQEDHLKILGADFIDLVAGMPGGTLLEDGVEDARRAELEVRPGKAPFFVWKKDG